MTGLGAELDELGALMTGLGAELDELEDEVELELDELGALMTGLRAFVWVLSNIMSMAEITSRVVKLNPTAGKTLSRFFAAIVPMVPSTPNNKVMSPEYVQNLF
jgi:hypothetical protein